MKLYGQTPSLATSVLVLPRPDGGLVFKFEAVRSYDEFRRLVPEPQAPMATMAKTGNRVPNLNDKTYLAELAKYQRLHSCWLTIQSLKPTPGLVWETVEEGDPESWLKLEDELLASNLTKTEVRLIVDETMKVNCLDDAMLDEARKRFLAEEAALLSQSASRMAEQPNTQSGEPANA